MRFFFRPVYLKKISKGAQNMYKLFNKLNDPPTGKIAWNKKYKIDEKEWNMIYAEPFKITKNTVAQWFKTRINHKIVATNTFYIKLKLITTLSAHFAQKLMKLLNTSYGNVTMCKNL